MRPLFTLTCKSANVSSFWIAPSASIPGRSALLITSYLILTNMSASAVDFDSPTFTAMDVWFYACQFFVGLAILEFFLILRLGSKPLNVIEIYTQENPATNGERRTSEKTTANYDHYAFVIFNVVFVLFCVVYVFICLSLK